MKIALVALAQPREPRTRLMPPLSLAYIGALLEQQRHIVRLLDLGVSGAAGSAALAPLRSFRPNLIVIAGPAAAPLDADLRALAPSVIRLQLPLRQPLSGATAARALWQADERAARQDEQRAVFAALLALDDDLDTLPFPARHLLPLEQYPLFTPTGDLQTPVVYGQVVSGGAVALRQPAMLLAEIQSVVQEHGIGHFVLVGPSITRDPEASAVLLKRLRQTRLGVCWEAVADYRRLTPELLGLMRAAGCEVLALEFPIREALEPERRTLLMETVAQAHAAGMAVRATIALEPPFEPIAALVDVSATLRLDDVRFDPSRVGGGPPGIGVSSGLSSEDVAEMAQLRYRSSRSRQLFIERFGPQLGVVLWRVGRAGLLGQTWQRYAAGDEGLAAA